MEHRDPAAPGPPTHPRLVEEARRDELDTCGYGIATTGALALHDLPEKFPRPQTVSLFDLVLRGLADARSLSFSPP